MCSFNMFGDGFGVGLVRSFGLLMVCVGRWIFLILGGSGVRFNFIGICVLIWDLVGVGFMVSLKGCGWVKNFLLKLSGGFMFLENCDGIGIICGFIFMLIGCYGG